MLFAIWIRLGLVCAFNSASVVSLMYSWCCFMNLFRSSSSGIFLPSTWITFSTMFPSVPKTDLVRMYGEHGSPIGSSPLSISCALVTEMVEAVERVGMDISPPGNFLFLLRIRGERDFFILKPLNINTTLYSYFLQHLPCIALCPSKAFSDPCPVDSFFLWKMF